jgi:hypothetical protein
VNVKLATQQVFSGKFDGFAFGVARVVHDDEVAAYRERKRQDAARLDLVGVGDEGAKHPLALACRAGNLKRRQQVQEVGDKDMQDAGGTNRSIVGLPPRTTCKACLWTPHVDMDGAHTPKNGAASTGNPAQFSSLRGVRKDRMLMARPPPSWSLLPGSRQLVASIVSWKAQAFLSPRNRSTALTAGELSKME